MNLQFTIYNGHRPDQIQAHLIESPSLTDLETEVLQKGMGEFLRIVMENNDDEGLIKDAGDVYMTLLQRLVGGNKFDFKFHRDDNNLLLGVDVVAQL